MDSKTKINWVLILQAWAMLWVVIGHAPLLPVAEQQPLYVDILYRFAYSFHMPLFILVSGYLFYMTRIERPMPYGRMILDKLKRLGIPYLFFTIVAMVLKTMFGEHMTRPSSISIGELVHSIIYPGEGPLSELWFIAMILWMFILCPIWTFSFKHKYLPLLYILLLTILHLYANSIEDIELLSISSVMKNAIFFYLGLLTRKLNFINEDFKTKYLFSAFAIFCCLYVFAYRNEITLLPALFGIGLSISLALLLNRYVPKTFSSFRNYTYQIYLMAIFIQIFIKILYKQDIIPSYLISYILCILTGLYIPVVTSIIVKKINFTPLNLCLGLASAKNTK